MRPAQLTWPLALYFSGHFRSRRASAFPYPCCWFQYALTEFRRWCHTTAEGWNPIFPPLRWMLQQISTSSPALRKRGSNPPAASSADLRKAMLQPGICSASRSETRTCTGPPGALATHSAIGPSPGGRRLGPPTPTKDDDRKDEARNFSQCGSG